MKKTVSRDCLYVCPRSRGGIAFAGAEDRIHPVLFAGEEAAEGTGEPAPAKGAGVLWKYLMKFV